MNIRSARKILKEARKPKCWSAEDFIEGYEAGVKDSAKLLMSDHSINDSPCANGNCEHIELSNWILEILDEEIGYGDEE